MIAHLSGKLISKQPSNVVIDVGGVGYEVSIPLSTFYEVGEVGQGISLIVHTHVREDAIQLFGFKTPGEKDLFLKLTAISGIGPKLGVTILSGLPVADLIQAIVSEDAARLTAIPGVGKKTAERIIVELRDKLKTLPAFAVDSSGAQGFLSGQSAVVDDTVAALIGLGYPKAIAERAVAAVISEPGERTIEAVLKRALKRFSP